VTTMTRARKTTAAEAGDVIVDGGDDELSSRLVEAVTLAAAAAVCSESGDRRSPHHWHRDHCPLPSCLPPSEDCPHSSTH